MQEALWAYSDPNSQGVFGQELHIGFVAGTVRNCIFLSMEQSVI
jgi:hypothetical protein